MRSSFSGDDSDNDVEIAVLNEFWLGKSNLLVKGDLRIQGEEDKRVIIGGPSFDLDNPTSVNWWGGIIFEGLNVGSLIEYTEIRYADVALVFTGSSMSRITNSIIADNDVGIMTFDFSSPRIIGNRIEKNTLWGISCLDSSFPLIGDNTIRQDEVGIGCQDYFSPTIQHNELADNDIDILVQDRSDSNTTF